MSGIFTKVFDTPVFKGKISFPTGLYIGGEFVKGEKGTTIEYAFSSKSDYAVLTWCSVINPTNGELITKVDEALEADVNKAVKAAQKAFDTTWGLNASGAQRAALLNKLGSLMDKYHDELAAIEALDNGLFVSSYCTYHVVDCITGKTFGWAKGTDTAFAIQTIKYYAGWADKISGQVIETDENKLCYTRHEPMGVVGQIVPWNFPLLLLSWKIGPALATGNCIVLKPSEFTPLTAIRMCSIIEEAGFPKGVVNIVTGYGPTAGAALASHMDVEKVS